MGHLDQVRLPDGRRLDVRVSGPEDGTVLVFHHGTPGARTPTRALERAAHDRRLRVVTMSRPGYGGSDRHRGRRVVDVAADTEAVLAALGAERCLVAGWSGGGPHALACAARLSAAVGALVIAGVAPFDADGLDWTAGMGQDNLDEFAAALAGEAALGSYLAAQRDELKQAGVGDLVDALASLLPAVDRAALTDEFGEDFAASLHEALRLGTDGWLDDDLAFTRPWGFSLEEIRIPTLLWQGDADLMVPFAHGRWLASRVPNAAVHLEDSQGHLSMALGALDRMLDELVAALPT